MEVFVRNIGEARLFFERLEQRLNKAEFLAAAAAEQEKDVKNRIVTRDHGRWKPASKWIRAKKGTDKALVGVEKFVHSRVVGNRAQVIGEIPGNWTLTQHHRGFENKLYSNKDTRHGNTITINLVDPLALPWIRGSATKFSWIARRRGKTPARKIWPDEPEAIRDTVRIASRWLAKAVREAGGRILR